MKISVYSMIVPCCILLLMSGCSGGAPEFSEKLTPVTGTVTVNGKPTPGVAVTFTPEAGTSGTGGHAVTDEQGKYQVLHRTDQAGIQPGKYLVTFSKITQKDGTPIPEGKGLADVDWMQGIPPQYSKAENSKIRTEIAETPASIDFELKF